MSNDSLTFSGDNGLAEEITVAVDDISRHSKLAFSLIMDELESLKQREADLVLQSQRILSGSSCQYNDSMQLAMDSSILKLNVGGKHINARRSSFLPRTSPDSLFGILVSGRWDNHLTKDQNGRIFFDIDPEWFEVVINVLRDTGKIVRPCVAPEMNFGFCAVLACYNLKSLLSDFTIDLSEESEIGSMNEPYNREILHLFLRPELAEEKPRRLRLKLLYRFPRDGDEPEDLHSRCQGNGNTLTVIEDTNGSVVGCYAEGKWNLSSPIVEGKKSFHFCLTTALPEKVDLSVVRPFSPDSRPGDNLLYFGNDLWITAVDEAYCDMDIFTECSTSGIEDEPDPAEFEPKYIEVYQIESMATPVDVDTSTTAPAPTSDNATRNPSDMAVEADGKETERPSKITIASLVMTDKMTCYNRTFVAQLRALSESIFKAERELLMEILLVRQLTAPLSPLDIKAGLEGRWAATVAEIGAIDSITCGNKQSDMIKELLLELNVTGAEAEAVAVTAASVQSRKRSFSETQSVEDCREVISFDVGGTIIAVLRGTLLRQAPDSVFASRVSDRWRESADEIVDGHVCLVSKLT